MLDFPSFITTDGKRYNEPFYENLARVVMDEFPARPHWTKNTREIFKYGKKNLDAGVSKKPISFLAMSPQNLIIFGSAL